jgi:hypothetical protein
MIVIAVLLLAAVGAATAGVIVGAEGDVVFDIFDETITASGPGVFAAGAACGLAVALAVSMGLIGARRSRLRRRQMRAMRRERDREHADLAREREELQAERERVGAPQSADETESARPSSRFAAGWGRRRAAARTEQDEHATAER